jgi:hypothetical protein
MYALAYLGLAALIVLGVFTIVHLIRSWKAAGRRWGLRQDRRDP